MPHLRDAARRLCLVGALALTCGLASVALAGNGVQWRLNAQVPVVCAILEVTAPSARPENLAIATTCNAERYQLVLGGGGGSQAASLRAARSSAGPAQISGSAVTITSARPGYALTTIELSAPVDGTSLSVTLQPL